VWSYSNHADNEAIVPDEYLVDAEMEPGSALVFLGSTLHGQGCNSSDGVRRAFVVGYSLSWLKQFENQFLSYPPEVARRFPRELAELVGYAPIPSNLNSYDGRSPMLLLEEEVPEFPGAVDLFRPNQCEAIDHYLVTGTART
jgi:ectoine hydroxylase-related dioxygenase (phytanoyl-CoA dioxygenase family)